MFKYLQALPKYAPGRKREDIKFIIVTEFYNLERIEARKAFYVIGSDVMGPMGRELVPLATSADAEEFLKEHNGKRILNYEQVTPEIIGKVDTGKF
jgi:nitrous oxide reductase accessory protein NosL